jgi:hypothetical protein
VPDRNPFFLSSTLSGGKTTGGKEKGGAGAFENWSSAAPPRRQFGLRRLCHCYDLIQLAFQFVVRFELAWINDRNQ